MPKVRCKAELIDSVLRISECKFLGGVIILKKDGNSVAVVIDLESRGIRVESSSS